MTTTISFVSQKGGVGKTTSAVNLSTALAFGGYKVLLIDLDPQSSVRYSFGVKNQIKAGTKKLFLDSNISVQKFILRTDQENMHFIFSDTMTLEEEKQMGHVAEDDDFLRKRLLDAKLDYDFIVIDAPASTGPLTLNAVCAADLNILPLQCESLAVKSLKRFLVGFNELQKKLPHRKLRIAGILLTMYDQSLTIHQKVAQQINKALGPSVFKTVIPKSPEITEASALGRSVITYDLNCEGAATYVRLMDELIDKFSLR